MDSVTVNLELRSVQTGNQTLVEGTLVTADGTRHDFTGWMSLLGMLEDVTAGAPLGDPLPAR